MLITLITEQRFFSIHLPEKCVGKYWIIDEELSVDMNHLVGIEADSTGNHWIIKGSKDLKLYKGTERTETDVIELVVGELYPMIIGSDNPRRAFLFVEDESSERNTYVKYRVKGDCTFTIGKAQDNQVIINNAFVSSHHAQVAYQSGRWMIADSNSSNGIYINRRRMTDRRELEFGDVVFILGFKMVIGNDFIAINNPGGKVELKFDRLGVYEVNDYMDDETIIPREDAFFYRSPRFQREIEPLELKVDMPTMKDKMDETPIFLTLMPAMLMGVASFSSGIVTTVNTINNGGKIFSSLPTLVMSISMLCGMVLFPFLMKNRDKKKRREKEQERRDKYHNYIQSIKNEIIYNMQQQEEILRENAPNILKEVSEPEFWQRKLWSKTPRHSDFLSVRLGMGNAPMQAEIKFPEDRFSIDDDSLKEELFSFQKEEQLLKNVPICISLKEERVVGIIGSDEERFKLLNNIISQLVALHSYDEIKIVCITDLKDQARIDALRFAHHVWDNENRVRYYAATEENARELSIEMNKIITDRKENSGANAEFLPYYVVISTSKQLEKKCTFFNDILKPGSVEGFCVITAYEELSSLPKECNCVVELSKQLGTISKRDCITLGKQAFMQDEVSKAELRKVILQTSNYQLDLQQGKYALPGMLTFLDMFKVGKYEHLNIRERWRENNPVMTLQTPVGVDTNGDVFYLDLHEKFHGPHGLVAGMTGSGKSEFIITYILSLAVNYHPNEVAFVLIDYKGGGLTGAFDNEKYTLPHLAGTITNLDLSAITRSILSIKSELRRRQAVFNYARGVANEGTMDIYKYQKMYRDGLVQEPLPHLFIISDEFAELKSQQPEFMEQLISTARIGRSLGVHLILATQKPSGVVNEQIWANSKFKVCLKVQDKADSMDMLKRPDAAGIAETGRFYLQVGYNELFEMGQSAWCGAPYTDSETVSNGLDGTIEVIDNLGNVIDKVKERKTGKKAALGKQIVRIMEHLNEIAKEDNIVERQLWLPVIASDITLEETLNKYAKENVELSGLSCVIGELDDPYTQSQKPMILDFSTDGNMLLYGSAGSGKELLLTTMLVSLYQKLSAERLNTYILDFGAESLKIFENAPQTGGVVIAGEDQRVASLFSMLTKEMRARKKILSEQGLDFEEYNVTSEVKMPYILLIVNNYSNFVESFEKYEETIQVLSREASKYGIYLVMTATSASAVRYRIVQNFGRFLAMQLNDKTDYVSIMGNTQGVFPSKIYGRGIVKKDEVYEFQTALLAKTATEQREVILGVCRQCAAQSDICAQNIPVVPKFISGKERQKYIKDFRKVGVGMAFESYQYATWDFEQKNVLQILSQSEGDALRFAGGIMEGAACVPEIEYVVFNATKDFAEYMTVPYQSVSNDEKEQKVLELFNTAVSRNNDYKKTDGCPTVDMHPIVCVFNSFVNMRAQLSEDGYDKLVTMFSKVQGFCNMSFLVVDAYQSSHKYGIESWYGERCGGEGIWVGDGVSDQIRMMIHRKTPDLNAAVGDNTGYIIESGVAKRVRFIMPEQTEVEEDA